MDTKLTHRQIIQLGRGVLRRAGYGDQYISQVLPYWVDGYKRGRRAARK